MKAEALTIVALLVGFLLSRFDQFFERRRKRKELAGNALTGLLEIRHSLKSIIFNSKNLSTIADQHGIPLEQQILADAWLDSFFSQLTTATDKFSEAIDILATVDPILAYKLQSKDKILLFLRGIKDIARQHSQFYERYSRLEKRYIGLFLEIIEELIPEVAKIHGWVTWFNAKQIIRQKEIYEITEKILLLQDDLLEGFKGLASDELNESLSATAETH